MPKERGGGFFWRIRGGERSVADFNVCLVCFMFELTCPEILKWPLIFRTVQAPSEVPRGALSAIVSTPFSLVIGAQRLNPFHLGRQHIPEGCFRHTLIHSVPCLQIHV